MYGKATLDQPLERHCMTSVAIHGLHKVAHREQWQHRSALPDEVPTTSL